MTTPCEQRDAIASIQTQLAKMEAYMAEGNAFRQATESRIVSFSDRLAEVGNTLAGIQSEVIILTGILKDFGRYAVIFGGVIVLVLTFSAIGGNAAEIIRAFVEVAQR